MPSAQSVPPARVRSSSRSQRGGGDARGSPLRTAASTSSISAQPKRPRSSCSRRAGRRRARRRSGRGRCSSTARRVARPGRSPLPSPRAVASSRAGLDQLQRLGLVAAPRGEHQRRVPRAARCRSPRLIASASSISAAAAANSPACTCSRRVGERERKHGRARRPRARAAARGSPARATSRRPTVGRDRGTPARASACRPRRRRSVAERARAPAAAAARRPRSPR